MLEVPMLVEMPNIFGKTLKGAKDLHSCSERTLVVFEATAPARYRFGDIAVVLSHNVERGLPHSAVVRSAGPGRGT